MSPSAPLSLLLPFPLSLLLLFPCHCGSLSYITITTAVALVVITAVASRCHCTVIDYYFNYPLRAVNVISITVAITVADIHSN